MIICLMYLFGAGALLMGNGVIDIAKCHGFRDIFHKNWEPYTKQLSCIISGFCFMFIPLYVM